MSTLKSELLLRVSLEESESWAAIVAAAVSAGGYDKVNSDIMEIDAFGWDDGKEIEVHGLVLTEWMTTRQVEDMILHEGRRPHGLRALLAVGATVPILQRSCLIVALRDRIHTKENGPIQLPNLWGTSSTRGLGLLTVDESFEWRPGDMFLTT